MRQVPTIAFQIGYCNKFIRNSQARRNLQPGERIVSDHYEHKGLLIYASQRITSDPKDDGRRCEPEGRLEDVVRRIHENCYYRTRGGNCNSCQGTPIANT